MKKGFKKAEHFNKSSVSSFPISSLFKASHMSEALAGFPTKMLVMNNRREFSLLKRKCLNKARKR